MTHPKLYDLMSKLRCSRPCALGYLQLLWDFTADHAPRGDIGKWPDGAIARACEWSDDAAFFMTAMTESGWVDRHPDHRLLIHDWSKHCERWVLAKLEKNRLKIITTGASTEDTTGDTTEVAVEASLLSSPLPLPLPLPSKIGSASHAAKPRRATALPPDFLLTQEHRDYALSKGVTNPEKEFEAFRAHHEAHGKVMKSWDAAWHTWCFNVKKFGGREPPRSAGSMGGVLR